MASSTAWTSHCPTMVRWARHSSILHCPGAGRQLNWASLSPLASSLASKAMLSKVWRCCSSSWSTTGNYTEVHPKSHDSGGVSGGVSGTRGVCHRLVRLAGAQGEILAFLEYEIAGHQVLDRVALLG